MMAPDDFRDEFAKGLAHAYSRGCTTDAEARAIRDEVRRRRQLADYWEHAQDLQDDLQQAKAYALRAALVAGMVGICLVGGMLCLGAMLVVSR